MPTPIGTIQPFVDRLLRDPGALMTDAIFSRAFGVLSPSSRDVIMNVVEYRRRQEATERAEDSRLRRHTVDNDINNYVISDEAHTVAVHIGHRRGSVSTDPAAGHVQFYTTIDAERDERIARIAQMRRDMAREIEEFRFDATEAYQRRPEEFRNTQRFQMWSDWVEQTVSAIRAGWERRISAETPAPRPTPPDVRWPDPADYGPNAGYRSVRGALNAFTRAVSVIYRTRVTGGAWEETRDRVHINGTRDIRIAWAGWQEMPRAVPPPPTTTVWVDEPEIDELDILIKHLPRGRKFMLVVSDDTTLSNAGRKLATAGITGEYYHIHTVKMMIGASSNAVRVLRYPVYIDPAVFKMHAARQGDWSDADLDAVIELQGEIPDEETMA